MALVDPGERAKQERRRQIIAAAKTVFSDAGYHGASINSIIERAQIARGTFYLYFEDKRGIFEEIVDRVLARIGMTIQTVDPHDPNRTVASPLGSSTPARPEQGRSRAT